MSPAEANQEETVPAPDFSSLTKFTLKRAEIVDNSSGCMSAENPSDLEISSVPSPFEINDCASIMRTLKFKQRPWIVYDPSSIERESDIKHCDMSLSPKVCLPKGVTRGCPDCSGCQKVSARWDPAGACSYTLKDAIVFHPNEEEFKDAFKYIDSIRQQVEPFGLCRIVPPSSWKQPSFFEEDDIWQKYKISTRVQRPHELQYDSSYRKAPTDNDNEAKRRKLDCEYGDACAANFGTDECYGSGSFQIEYGPEFSLIAFKRYADDFQQCYFSGNNEVLNDDGSQPMHHEQRDPTEQHIEGEFWRIVEKPTEEIEVLYGSNIIQGPLSSSKSGQASDSIKGVSLNLDLNRLYKFPGSMLSFETLDSSNILAPQLHVGMCFSCLPWALEEHHLYKLQYLHFGAPRIWYGIPGSESHNFEAIAKKHLPWSDDKQADLLHTPGRQLSPATIKAEGVPVYRCIQRPGEFVLFLPGAYHSGFDCGFNCAVSSVLAPLDWLPHGQVSLELYREKNRKTYISYDKVLLRASNEAVKAQWEYLLRGKKTSNILMWKEASGKDKILAKSLRARIRSELRSRDYLSSASQSRKMDKSFNGDGQKLECCICRYDLYLSAVTCPCDRNRFSCLIHAKHFCSCAWTGKIFFFRYEINELKILADAVEGKLSAVRTWIKENLGLMLRLEKPNHNQNIQLDPSTAAIKDNITSKIGKASGSKLLSETKKTLGMNLDDFKHKAGTISSKYTTDDDTSSSSSDIDIDEYITHLEMSLKRGATPASSNGVSMGIE
ncbi:putative lysine-specific demethylase JMJ16 isoform X1 [Amaranthus tricolor]|uniref:putative lysine-specific demethylase JMJ16 isoform X1 n=1 Tax=Amaranthus tricolor TaxID=29722 RepID=UPI00258E8B89|nr:putative lysine-specific demethylase JMJ16 isoform X1 [Amaranthus tricolor]